MKNILIGKKLGSTQILTDSGEATHVTVVLVQPSTVVYSKSVEKHGYRSLVLATGERKAKKMNLAEQGFAKKHGIGRYQKLYEMPLIDSDKELDSGSLLDINTLSADFPVDIRSTSKGKGFAGTIKRWNFAGQDRSHGNSVSHRVPGSIGINGIGRVLKGKKMSGHMGNSKVTIRNLKLVKIDKDKSIIFIKGSIPGFNGSEVVVKQELIDNS